MSTKQFIFTLLFILGAILYSEGQCEFWEERILIVHTSGDTTRAFLHDQDHLETETSFGFLTVKRPENDCKKENIKTKDITKVIHGQDHYHYVIGKMEDRFLKLVFDDSIKYYHGSYKKLTGGSSYLRNPTTGLYTTSGNYSPPKIVVYKYLDFKGEIIKVPKKQKKFNKKMAQLFSDNITLSKEIKAGKYHTFQIKKILIQYCDWMRNQNKE